MRLGHIYVLLALFMFACAPKNQPSQAAVTVISEAEPPRSAEEAAVPEKREGAPPKDEVVKNPVLTKRKGKPLQGDNKQAAVPKDEASVSARDRNESDNSQGRNPSPEEKGNEQSGDTGQKSKKSKKTRIKEREAEEDRQFAPYEKKNTAKGYLAFIEKYPRNRWVPKAKLAADELEFAPYAEQTTIEGYEQFMRKYPRNRFVPVAKAAIEDIIFERVKEANTIIGYAEFMKDYPTSSRVPEALQGKYALEYATYKAKDTLEGYAEFIHEYPLNSFQDEAVKRYNTLDAERVKAETGKICDERKHAGGRFECTFVSFSGGAMVVKFEKPDETIKGQEYLMGGPGYAEEVDRRYQEWKKGIMEKLYSIFGVISIEESPAE